jgi:sugar porter (SP) family MFS transporter
MAATSRSTRIALVAALGGFLLGFDATVISGVVPFIRDYFGLGGAAKSFALGWAVSSLGWGAMVGNLCTGILSDRYGRRSLLLLTAVLFFGSSLLAATAHSYPTFILARVLAGLAVGAAILTAPMYIAEIAPAERRGLLVSTNQLMIVIGISASFFSNDLLLQIGAESWRWMLAVEAIPALVFLALLTTVPESPRWLLTRGRREEALHVMRTVRGREAEKELEHIRLALPGRRSGSWSGVFGRRMRFVMVFVTGLAFFQQITGVNAVLYFLPTIFARAGGGLESAFRQTAIVGAVNLAMTLVAMRWVDRLGRKPLLILGTGGMAAALLAAAWAFRSGAGGAAVLTHPTLVLVAVVAYVASFAISLGPVTWVMMSELFPNEQRAFAVSIVGFWNALASAVVTLVFPWETTHWGISGTFFGYAILALAALVFVLCLGPETRGKTLEEIEQLFLDRRVWPIRQSSMRHEAAPGPAR